MPNFNNKTGLASAPERARPMVDASHNADPTSGGIEQLHDQRRARAAEPQIFGSMAPPKREEATVPPILLDRLGERLAFERSGVRLYDALLLKYDAKGPFEGGPSREDLERFRDEELGHFHLLEEIVESLGGDPTAMTPAADLAATEAKGILDVIADARVSLSDSLHALLVAELADNAAWDHLVGLCEHTGKKELVGDLRRCEEQEQQHLGSVKRWLQAHDMNSSSGATPS